MNAANGLLEELVGAPAVQAGTVAAPIRAFAWARVSTDMQEERGLSIPEQLREIRAYAEKHGIEIVGEYSEAASAFQRDSKRTEFHRMVAEARRNPDVSLILIHDFSRFSRDSGRGKTLMRDLRDAGIRIVSLNDPEVDPDSVAGVYMEAITFAKNEAFSREVAFHTRKGCRANVQARDPETGWCYKNGGQPLWGYRSRSLDRGAGRSGRGIVKSIWELDDALVQGREAHEWVRHCLVELAGNGASLSQMREFCNRTGIPARRKTYWGISTWNAILQPHILLQYCGFGIWNVHRKNGSLRPQDEWVIVENAHPAILTPDEARRIAAARKGTTRFDRGFGKSRVSDYLLSGGPFKCERCGANMIGFTTSSGRYYVCGSQPYRKGMGCGPGVYVPQGQVEAEVLKGVRALVGVCTDPAGFTKQVNEELRRIWQERHGHEPDAAKKIAAVDKKIANIHRAIEDGLGDATWANTRLGELQADRRVLVKAAAAIGEPPQVDVETALAHRRDLDRLLAQPSPAERKRFLRTWLGEIKLAPERREVSMTYRIPEPVMNRVVAGGRYEPATSSINNRPMRSEKTRKSAVSSERNR